MVHMEDSSKLNRDFSLLEQVLIDKAEQYLENQVIESLKADIRNIATDAVKTWAEYRFSLEPRADSFDTNINIQFVEKIIKTQMRDNPIKITVKEK